MSSNVVTTRPSACALHCCRLPGYGKRWAAIEKDLGRNIYVLQSLDIWNAYDTESFAVSI
ncbi:hypothetical protein [Lysobacter gummosus]|uniref:hypothetical protein n=1 Tax=Lysobacter gummosus TaxID=262324 RepID=UPI00362E76A0